jgi:hypothetical protein
MSEMIAHDWRNLINSLFIKTAVLNKPYSQGKHKYAENPYKKTYSLNQSNT